MTRRSRREIERSVDDLEPDGGDDADALTVVFEDPSTGAYYDTRALDGDPVDPDDETGLVIVLSRGVVMDRKRAEREGRDILGSADVPAEDAVRVAPE